MQESLRASAGLTHTVVSNPIEEAKDRKQYCNKMSLTFVTGEQCVLERQADARQMHAQQLHVMFSGLEECVSPAPGQGPTGH